MKQREGKEACIKEKETGGKENEAGWKTYVILDSWIAWTAMFCLSVSSLYYKSTVVCGRFVWALKTIYSNREKKVT